MALHRSVDNILSKLLHPCDAEIGLTVLLFKMLMPLCTLISIDSNWHIVFEQFEWVSEFTSCFVIAEASAAISNHEVITFESENILNAEIVLRRVLEHELGVTIVVTEKDLTAVSADEEVV